MKKQKTASVKVAPAADVAKAKISREELNAIYQVKLGFQDPNKVDLEKYYQDNCPPEAMVLDEFLKNQKKDKDSKDNVDVNDVQKKLRRNQLQIDHFFPPD